MVVATPNNGQSAGLAYVLDDEARIAALVCQYLQACGYEPRAFSTALPFLAQTKTIPPAVIVLDLALGETDAVEMIRRLEVLQFAGTVLLISGRDRSVLRESERIGRAHGLKMLPSLQKPFRLPDLRAALAAVPEEPARTDKKPRNQQPSMELVEALDNDWLELWYQPKIELKSLEVSGAEALLRARHPLKGIIAPLEFLPSAGDPIYQRLTRFVLQRAMTDWYFFADEQSPLRLSINVPVSVLCAPDFVGNVRTMLAHYPKVTGLIAEITEDEIVRDRDAVREVATQLALCNISLSIDDFGSAYSSLARLLEVPCVEIKIDRTFVTNCAADALKRTLCESVIRIAHEMGVTVCAEGVESSDDLLTLIAIGCDTAQGFIFGRPMPRDILVSELRTQRGLIGASPSTSNASPTGPDRTLLWASRMARL
jgi:EAL domain-containing protein (putative c-di-GMP-specific phosphodiesterase class I)/CheY-like chemotaxis protein